MYRAAFRMELRSGCFAEYVARHAAMWPEVVELLAARGVRLAVHRLAEDADVVIVLGSQNSSNSLRLAELGGEQTGRAYLVDSVDELPEGWNTDVQRVVVTAGASAPEDVVEDCLRHLKITYGATVEEVTVSEEHVRFPLPKGLQVLESQDDR